MSIYYRRGPRITLRRIITAVAPRMRVWPLVVFALLMIIGAFAHARDLDGRYAQSPTIAVLATICLDSCQDVVVTTSEHDSSITMMWCAIGGQLAIAEWLAQNKPGYRLQGWKCVVGDRRRGA